AVEVLVEEDQVAPAGVDLELLAVAVNRAAAALVAQEETAEAAGKLACHLPEGHLLAGAGRELYLERGTHEVIELLQRLDEQVGDWEPDRPAPVRVAPEQPGGRFAGFVVHLVLVPVHRHPERTIAMDLGEGANAVRRQ